MLEVIREKQLGLSFEVATTFEQWAAMVEIFKCAPDRLMWALGDWLAFGGAKKWGDRYDAAAMATGYPPAALRDARWVAEAVPVERRRSKLTWAHHREVAHLDEQAQEKWLTKAEASQMAREQLKAAIVGKPAQAKFKFDGIYTPYAVRVDFDRAYRQTTEKLPLEKWPDDMAIAWARELEPIAKLYTQLAARVGNTPYSVGKESFTAPVQQR